MNIIFRVDEKNRVIPDADDVGQELECGQYRGYITGNAYEEHCVPLWKFDNGICVQRSAEEIQTDIDLIPIPDPTEQEILRADVDFLLMLMEE